VITAEQQQIDAAMERLSAYVAESPWDEWMVEVFTETIDYAAEMLEISDEDILDYLEEPPLGPMAHAHVFEHFVTTETNEDGETVLQAFLRAQLRGESVPYAYSYLQALGNAPLTLWDVVGFKSGEYAEVRRLGTNEPPVQVQMSVTDLPEHICIAARLIRLSDGSHTFSFGLLPIERNEAEDILAYLDQVKGEMLSTAKEETPNQDGKDVDAAIAEELTDLLFSETFAAWIGQGFED